MKFGPYILKNLLRHRVRSLLTASGAAVALFVFAVIGAAEHGLADLTRGSAAWRTLVVFQANRFCPSTSRLPMDYAETVAKIPGVSATFPIRTLMNNCRASLDLVLFHGVPPEKLRTARALDFVSGDWESFARQTDAALVGSALAQRRRLAPGQKFTLGEFTVTVVGVFRAEKSVDENLLYCHLDFLQRAKNRIGAGTVTQIEATLADDADPTEVCRRIDERFRGERVATNTKPKSAFQAGAVGDLAELVGMANFLGYACLGLVFALVSTTQIMAVHDRIREHAVLQAIGYTGGRIFGFVVSEGIVLTFVGGAIGVTAATFALRIMRPTIGAEGVNVALVPSAEVVLYGLLTSAAVGVLASVVPAWQAARIRIVEAMR